MPSSSHRRANVAPDRKPYAGADRLHAVRLGGLADALGQHVLEEALDRGLPGFTQYDSSALYRRLARVASEKMAAVLPPPVPARNTRTAISPRFAHRIFASLPVFERRTCPSGLGVNVRVLREGRVRGWRARRRRHARSGKPSATGGGRSCGSRSRRAAREESGVSRGARGGRGRGHRAKRTRSRRASHRGGAREGRGRRPSSWSRPRLGNEGSSERVPATRWVRRVRAFPAEPRGAFETRARVVSVGLAARTTLPVFLVLAESTRG